MQEGRVRWSIEEGVRNGWQRAETRAREVRYEGRNGALLCQLNDERSEVLQSERAKREEKRRLAREQRKADEREAARWREEARYVFYLFDEIFYLT